MADFLDQFKAILKADQILSESAVKERYNHIWKMNEPLQAKAFLLPKTTEEISQIMKVCHQEQQPVVVFGGLTNLVGSTETNKDEVVISLERMNQLVEIDTKSRTLTVEAGAILENVQHWAREHDLLFPLNFGAKGSAQIGGAIATNAGGLRVLRFGMTRNLILGLEVVLANGTILSNLKKIVKDNSGYDLKQLFIGSEGTLGIVTKAVLKLVEAPSSRVSAWVACSDYHKVTKLLRFMDQGMAGILSGFELVWKESFKTLTADPSVRTAPLPLDYPYYVLVEGMGSQAVKDQAMLEALLENALEEDLIEDAAIAYSNSDLEAFWHIRENVDALVVNCEHDQHFDISVPISAIGDTVTKITQELYQIEGVNKVYAFGHVADGNIHFIVGKSNTTDQLRKQIDAVVYGPIPALKGSVSAEHGIGNHKKAYLKDCRTPEEILTMKLLKDSLDPHHILNRGKVLA